MGLFYNAPEPTWGSLDHVVQKLHKLNLITLLTTDSIVIFMDIFVSFIYRSTQQDINDTL